MVVTKVFQIKNQNKLKQSMSYVTDKDKTNSKQLNNLLRSLNYIIDERKTLNDNIFMRDSEGKKQLVSSYGLMSVKTAEVEFMMTKAHAKQMYGDRQSGKIDVLAHHIIQSFSPDDKLTPEEVHEVGRKTALELTGGSHEFVIATHMDKDHLHNHIIFNSTNNVTLKKFKWQKGTKKSLENISDKHASIFGAKILDNTKVFGNKEYKAYLRKNNFRHEIKQRLDFLKRHSESLDDFLEKAKALNLFVDFNGKQAKYKLLDEAQQRNIRDDSISKKGFYSKVGIEKFINEIKDNGITSEENVTLENILDKYDEFKQYKDTEFELRFILEKWQIKHETNNGIYVDMSFGINNNGTIFIENKKFDKLENGNYELFIKYSDYFYFTNEKHAEKNKYMKGFVVANQLSIDNGQQLIKKNYHISRIDELIKEFNFLSERQITSGELYQNFVNDITKQIEDTEKELDRLDEKLAELNKIYSAVISEEEYPDVAQEILHRLNIPAGIDKYSLEKIINEVRIERDILQYKFKEITKEESTAKVIKQNIIKRENNKNIKK